MGNLESESKQKKKKKKRVQIAKIALGTIAVAGLLTVTGAVPNIIQVLKIFEGGSNKKTKYKYRVQTTLTKLVNEGSIRRVENDGKTYFELTAKGKAKAETLYTHYHLLKKPKKWDGSWRVIIFDIARKKNRNRDKFRNTLRQIGFVQLQRSVWVYPYDCEDFIELLKTDLRVGKEVLYMIVDKIEGDSKIKNQFGLS